MHGTACSEEIFDSHTERLYAEHLAGQKAGGEIIRFDIKPDNLKLAPNTYYVPDFRVVGTDRVIEFREVKGSKLNRVTGKWEPYSREKGWIKVKLAAALHPYRFAVIWWDKSAKTWLRREVS